jgi:hypothetical protein
MKRVLLCACVGIAIALPGTAGACSRFGFHPTVQMPTMAHFIATATADTVFAGAGSVRYVVATGHSGPGRDRSVFGQVVSVTRTGGLAARTLRQPVERVVLVPWDYGADCTPIPWTKSAAWVAPGTHGLFTGVLRDSAHWAGGVPTFDVFTPDFDPYPQQVNRQRGRRRAQVEIVPVEELFELMELFPDTRLLRDSAEAATAPLFRWARANPGLTGRYPIADVLYVARAIVRQQRLRAIESPLTGTWQLSVSLSGAPARTFYIRTERVPSTHWDSTFTPPRVDDPTVVPGVYGYYLSAAIAQTVDSLPASCERNRDYDHQGFIAVLNAPPVSSGNARTWTGELEAKIPGRAFQGDTALWRFANAAFDKSYRRSRAGLPPEKPARFTQSPDGMMRVEQVQTLESSESLVLSGVRIAPDVVGCR